MMKVGLTGGIGTGKSTVAKVFQVLGVHVYNSDIRAKQLLHESPELIENLKKEFGKEMYSEDNQLIKEKLSDLVFKNKEALEKLNSMVHPVVVEDFNNWCLKYGSEKYIIKESAILFESNTYKNLDKIISVYSPIDLRIKRIIKRDGISKEKVLEIMNNQWPEKNKMELADYVILSDHEHSIIDQVLAFHREFSF